MNGSWFVFEGILRGAVQLARNNDAGGFCVAGAALGALQGVGCTPASLRLRRSAGGFCLAGVGQCALPRAWMYAPVAFVWHRKMNE